MENNNERNKKTAKELIEDVKKQFEIEKNTCENKEEVDEKILNLISQELNDLVSKYN
ncbi:MAG: hypothetical protein KAW86_00485 [Bacteroidales bacterium]|nr:hypothetical protein [Bacteroidales bacterium]